MINNKLKKLFYVLFIIAIYLMVVITPIYASTTETYYPSGNSDGYARRISDGTWNSLVTGTGEQSNIAATSGYGFNIASTVTSDLWSSLARGFFFIDTSALPDTAIISSATLSLRGNSKFDFLSVTPNIGIYNTTSNNTNVATADYQTAGGTALSDTLISYSGFNTTGYNAFPLNAAGISAISKTGYTRFCSRNQSYDVTNNAPTWASDNNSDINIYFSDMGGAYRPKLDITYDLPSSGSTSQATSLASILFGLIMILVILAMVLKDVSNMSMSGVVLIAVIFIMLTIFLGILQSAFN